MRLSIMCKGFVFAVIAFSLSIVIGCSSRHTELIPEEPLALPIFQPIIVVSSYYELGSLVEGYDPASVKVHAAPAEYEEALRAQVESLLVSRSTDSIYVIPRSKWLIPSEDGDSIDTVRDSLGYLDMHHYARISGAASALSIRLAVMEMDMPVFTPFRSSLFSSESYADDSIAQEEVLVCQVAIYGVSVQTATRGFTIVNPNDSTNYGITRLAERIAENWPFATARFRRQAEW